MKTHLLRSLPLIALPCFIAHAAAQAPSFASQVPALAGPARSVSYERLQPRLPRATAPAFAADRPVDLGVDQVTDRPRLYYSAPLAAFFGIGGMLAGYGVGLGAFGCQDESAGCDKAPDDFEYTLGFAGLAIGAATGAHWGGRTHASQGSVWASLGGAAIGALPVLLMPKDSDQTGAWVAGMIAAPAGAVLADYFVRSPRRP